MFDVAEESIMLYIEQHVLWQEHNASYESVP